MNTRPINKVPTIITASNEQQAIIDAVNDGICTLVDAVAGSGKTTTVLFVAKNNENKRILQITYNKDLKLEVRKKADQMNAKNLEIHTYHSLAVKFYDSMAYTDSGIINVLEQNLPIRGKTIQKYDIVIIDEVQDMTSNYYQLVYKFLIDTHSINSIMLVLGDRYQGIYEFKDADSRFLTLSRLLWNAERDDSMTKNTLRSNHFISLPLQHSYRVTDKIAYFVNSVMLGYDRILTNKKSSIKVDYYLWNRYNVHSEFARKIARYIESGYKPDDIFVLSPTLKGLTNPAKKIENKLVESGIPVYYARNEEECINESIIKGKVVFTTFHQSKGRERKIVFVLGFDESFFEYHGKEKDRSMCPPELYVAVTRASEILVLLEDSSNNMLPFLALSHEGMKENHNINFYEDNRPQNKQKSLRKPIDQLICRDDQHTTNVTELVRYIGEKNTELLLPIVNGLFVGEIEADESTTTDIPQSVEMLNGLTEDCSDLNGLVIPALWETKVLKSLGKKDCRSSLERMADAKFHTLSNTTKQYIVQQIASINEGLDEESIMISRHLLLGNVYIAINECILSKLNQISTYDWLTGAMVDTCHENLSRCMTDCAVYEKELGDELDHGGLYYLYKTNSYGTIVIRGRVDAMTDCTAWEFKCTGSLSIDHYLQVIVYAWIYDHCMRDVNGDREFKLLNIRTGEVKRLVYQSSAIEAVVDILIANKYEKKTRPMDDIFLDDCKNIRKKYNRNSDLTESSASDRSNSSKCMFVKKN